MKDNAYFKCHCGQSVCIERFLCCTSTQDMAKVILSRKNTFLNILLLISENQVYGQSRKGFDWLSPPGAMSGTYIISYPSQASSMVRFSSMTAALSVAEMLGSIGISSKIKWENDVFVDECKISGILSEEVKNSRDNSYVLVGIGINCNIDTNITGFENYSSILSKTGKKLEMKVLWETLSSRILVNFGELFSSGFEGICERINKALLWRGRSASFSSHKNGTTIGILVKIDEFGRAILRENNGNETPCSHGSLKLNA
nr:biotin--[acetyl-CoA-carboxylase] ligase [Candidatus Hydrogenosomobacter endosymbioticus]